MITCIRNNNYLSDFIQKQSDEELNRLYKEYETLSEEIEHIFCRFDDNGNGELDLEEFEAVCEYINPELSKDLMRNL